jgi:hypothetical protein
MLPCVHKTYLKAVQQRFVVTEVSFCIRSKSVSVASIDVDCVLKNKFVYKLVLPAF